MIAVVQLLVFLGGSAALLGGLVWFAVRSRRYGVGSIGNQSMTAVDELFHPVAFEQQAEIQVQDERTEPAPTPDDL